METAPVGNLISNRCFFGSKLFHVTISPVLMSFYILSQYWSIPGFYGFKYFFSWHSFPFLGETLPECIAAQVFYQPFQMVFYFAGRDLTPPPFFTLSANEVGGEGRGEVVRLKSNPLTPLGRGEGVDGSVSCALLCNHCALSRKIFPRAK